MQIAETTPVATALDDLARGVDAVRDARAGCSDGEAVGIVTAALRAASALTAAALDVLGGRLGGGALERTTGLSPEILLMLEGRMTGWEARAMVQLAATLRLMPRTAEALGAGVLSVGQVRAIAGALKHLDAAGRERVDALVGTEAGVAAGRDPDELVARVEDLAASLRADLALAREDRAIEGGFLAVQRKLTGGGAFWGEADDEAIATLLQAVEAAAPDPVDPGAEGAPTRGAQHLEGLIAICESSLSEGGGDGTRPRPRFMVSVDLDDLDPASEAPSARLLWAMAGGPGRLTPLSTEVLACDATFTTVLFRGARPVAIGDAKAPITEAQRRAVVARDRGCRFPGCGAPASWGDCHHIVARGDGGPTCTDNLVLLCRRHHRAVHRHRWRITRHDDGSMEFARLGRRYASSPPRRPRRE